jgi:hypothetical protein
MLEDGIQPYDLQIRIFEQAMGTFWLGRAVRHAARIKHLKRMQQ